MFRTQVVQLAYQGLLLILILSAPPILISMFFGILVAIFQAATQIQEQTLSFTIKLVAVTLTLMFMGAWLGAQIMTFSINIFTHFPQWSLNSR
ncbi:type III secretion system export apparatus subunit SctS [Criblamydia sequanensis]|uniref:Type III secretion inner membrane protein SctS n=1 Tax=Candidatus Criblamydia sequanensis CRIB-18 TaxID=1437425 RepID=A0A090E1C8_9BACT|nr:type III secretion system export apparatus subunit SctS [Criblamydia sequanensis]CDR34564.1 Type III secretion inner membrane protein SctS [Criblamydia sequanensis CRIB-18]